MVIKLICFYGFKQFNGIIFSIFIHIFVFIGSYYSDINVFQNVAYYLRNKIFTLYFGPFFINLFTES